MNKFCAVRMRALTKVISEAKTHILGMPMKFDPQMERQRLQTKP